MLKTNLVLAFRNIFRNKLYSAINIIGLGMASAFCILIYLHVKNEQSFDKFHNDADQLYRVEETGLNPPKADDQKPKSIFSFLTKTEDEENTPVTPPVLGPALKQNFPEIESAVRFDGYYKPVIKVGNQSFQEDKHTLAFVDADFFKTFNFPLLHGDPETILSGHNQAVISERLAKKYFGIADPIGKTVLIPGDAQPVPVSIVGLMKNFPANSSMQFDMVMPITSMDGYAGKMKDGLNTFNEILIIKLKNGTDMARFQQKLDAFSKTYFKPLNSSVQSQSPDTKVPDTYIRLRPFADAHYNTGGSWEHYTNLKNIYQLMCLMVLILVIACFNYVLLTLTNAVSKSQDVGVRKTIGAGRLQIIVQYYTQTQVLAFVSVAVGFVLAVAAMPFFNSVTGADISLNSFSFADLGVLLMGLGLLLGLLAGIYPAYAMSGLKPLNIMRGFSAYRINPVLSKGLIMVQFGVCVVLVISSLIINKQMRFVSQTEMGFDKDQVVMVENPYWFTDKQQATALQAQLYHWTEMQPFMAGAVATSFGFGGANMNTHLVNGEKVQIDHLNADFEYFKFNKIPIVLGRDFSRDIAADSAKFDLTDSQKKSEGTKLRHNTIVNQTLYKMLGKPPLNVYNETIGGVIIGVCKDYHNRDLTQAIKPAYHTVNRGLTFLIWFRIKPHQSIPLAMEKLKAEWDKLTGKLPFNYTFLDEEVAKSYDAYLSWMATVTTSCIMAIILACLGLFGLSGLTTINRTKEIGIRKVLGASVGSLFVQLNRGTMYLAAGAFVIATPLAWYLANSWLQNFAYRIKPDWLLFATSAVISVITALAAVSYHTLKAARANPVDSLRNE
ncbi:putative ABC transport system permease protein [Mucilaginibacter oryzae]|uniref:Putative ABC transport system permease protein n=1 Tax=Mucilaginibacter oryzae TaxID=468058 RepID=A0A316HB85_9SPHI|nr:ABC transporter permease [Mucilaginibacter oryzae]PWK77543.1 putative ABC transport system permease protein [Mucilaginibacter oryzae]